MRQNCKPCLTTFENFYPRTPNGVRLSFGCHYCTNSLISIHALQTECDHLSRVTKINISISIHALQTECDTIWPKPLESGRDFYPRTPNGVRFYAMAKFYTLYDISIHALQTECDWDAVTKALNAFISIHALQAECDNRGLPCAVGSPDFYPRTPSGVRPKRHIGTLFFPTNFYPRTPSGVRPCAML